MIGVPIARLFGIEIRVQLGWIIVLAPWVFGIDPVPAPTPIQAPH